jgi:hypothetical protein
MPLYVYHLSLVQKYHLHDGKLWGVFLLRWFQLLDHGLAHISSLINTCFVGQWIKHTNSKSKVKIMPR